MPAAKSMRLSRMSIPSPGTRRVRDETAWGRLRRRSADRKKPYPCIGVATVGLQIPGAALMLAYQILVSQGSSTTATSFAKHSSRNSPAIFPNQQETLPQIDCLNSLRLKTLVLGPSKTIHGKPSILDC